MVRFWFRFLNGRFFAIFELFHAVEVVLLFLKFAVVLLLCMMYMLACIYEYSIRRRGTIASLK